MKFLGSRKFSLFIAVVVLAIGGSIFAFKSHDHEAADMSTMLGRRDLIQRVTISGQVWPRKRLDVKPTFTGYIVKLYVKVGERLKRGDPLVTFSPSLSSGEANFPVRAGFDGVVTQVLKDEGEFVSESGDQNLVIRFEDLSDLFVLATVPELDVAKLKIGQEALVRVSSLPAESFKGRIREIDLSAREKDKWSSSSTEFLVKVALDSHDPRLYPGLSAVMDIVTAKLENTLVLPHEYVQDDGHDGFLVTLQSGEKRPVKVGLQTDEAAEIKSGLKEGDRVKSIDYLNLPKLED